MSKLTADLFIEKALRKQEERKKPFELEVGDYGLVSFNYPNTNQLLNYMDDSAKAVTLDSEGNLLSQEIAQIVEASKELVFNCCPILKNSELQAKLGIEDPLDTPIVVFGIDEVTNIAAKIAEKAQGSKVQNEVVQEVKND